MLSRESTVFTLQPHAGKGRDYICGNELSFQEVIMDLGLRARQTQHREQRGWNMGADVENVCVHCGFVCTRGKDGSRTKAHTLFGWTSVQKREYWWILLGCLVGGWISRHKIPPIFKAPVRLEVMVSIPVARLGSSCHHRCIYWQCFIFCLGRPQNCLRSTLRWLEMPLLSLAGVLEVPFPPAKRKVVHGLVSFHDLWNDQQNVSPIRSIIVIHIF